MHTRPTEADVMEQARQTLAARIARDGRRHDAGPCPATTQGDEERRLRSLRCCHLPAAPKPRPPAPRDTGAFVPEMASRIEDDRNLTDGARRCARWQLDRQLRAEQRQQVRKPDVYKQGDEWMWRDGVASGRAPD